jgi:hypothetical protein
MWQRRVEVHSLRWCRLGRRELGTWIAVSVKKACESLRVDWFGKPSNTLEPSLWIHSPSLGVTLLLRFGTIESMIGWNDHGLQPVGVFFYKDRFSLLWYYLSIYECIPLCIYLSFNLIFRICMLGGYYCACC